MSSREGVQSIARMGTRGQIILVCSALVIRLAVALVSSGTEDVTNFVTTARLTQAGQVVYAHHQAYPYPPLYAHILAQTVSVADAFGIPATQSVRFPSILADSLIALLIYLIAYREKPLVAPQLAWVYALNPITIMICSHHGQFDSLAYLPAVFSILLFGQERWALSGLALGIGGALKITPAFIAPAWLPDLKDIWRRFLFLSLVGLPIIIAMLWGWLSAPDAFLANVLGHRQMAESGWGYNAITLILENVADALGLTWLRSITQWVLSYHQPIMIMGILITAYIARRRTFMERLLVTQLAVQLFAGRWGHEYTAWLVPVVVLSNQWGMIPWSILSALWMMLEYLAWTVSGSVQDNLFRAATVVAFLSWVSLVAWYIENIRGKHGRFSQSVFGTVDGRTTTGQV